MTTPLRDWIDERDREHGGRWYLKRLSANDTQANRSHQAGPYIPKQVLFSWLPELLREDELNPREALSSTVDSHGSAQAATQAIWYNGRTRNEARVTGWGGRKSPLLDPENTGAIAIFHLAGAAGARRLRVWICASEDDAEYAERCFGQIDPGLGVTLDAAEPETPVADDDPEPPVAGCGLAAEDVPDDWIETFPSPAEVFDMSVAMRPQYAAINPDERLVKRRECEFELFRSVENAVWLAKIGPCFATLEAFLDAAQTVLQRRRSRSGASLERHVRRILEEAGLVAGKDFDAQPQIESGKRPDFLFPSAAAYCRAADGSGLRMLAVKTSLRERWRQVLKEADRIERKHLLTLQEGVSEKQFAHMREAGLVLVVPAPLHRAYPRPVRDELVTVVDFLAEVRAL